MKINLRVKKLRQKLGLDFSSFVDNLFEDFPSELKDQYNEEYLKRIEADENAVDILLIQQILKKYRVDPYWLILGEGDIWPKRNALERKIAIQQQNVNSPNNNIEINIIDEEEAAIKMLSAENQKLAEIQGEIEKLKETMVILTKAYQNDLPKPWLGIKQLVACAMILLLSSLAIWNIDFSEKELPKNLYYEKYINRGQKEKGKPYFDYEFKKYRILLNLAGNVSEEKIKLRIVDYQEKVKIEKAIAANAHIELNTHNWTPGIYYFILLASPNNKIIYVDSVVKE